MHLPSSRPHSPPFLSSSLTFSGIIFSVRGATSCWNTSQSFLRRGNGRKIGRKEGRNDLEGRNGPEGRKKNGGITKKGS
jgi:hypothetical protein